MRRTSRRAETISRAGNYLSSIPGIPFARSNYKMYFLDYICIFVADKLEIDFCTVNPTQLSEDLEEHELVPVAEKPSPSPPSPSPSRTSVATLHRQSLSYVQNGRAVATLSHSLEERQHTPELKAEVEKLNMRGVNWRAFQSDKENSFFEKLNSSQNLQSLFHFLESLQPLTSNENALPVLQRVFEKFIQILCPSSGYDHFAVEELEKTFKTNSTCRPLMQKIASELMASARNIFPDSSKSSCDDGAEEVKGSTNAPEEDKIAECFSYLCEACEFRLSLSADSGEVDESALIVDMNQQIDCWESGGLCGTVCVNLRSKVQEKADKFSRDQEKLREENEKRQQEKRYAGLVTKMNECKDILTCNGSQTITESLLSSSVNQSKHCIKRADEMLKNNELSEAQKNTLKPLVNSLKGYVHRSNMVLWYSSLLTQNVNEQLREYDSRAWLRKGPIRRQTLFNGFKDMCSALYPRDGIESDTLAVVKDTQGKAAGTRIDFKHKNQSFWRRPTREKQLKRYWQYLINAFDAYHIERPSLEEISSHIASTDFTSDETEHWILAVIYRKVMSPQTRNEIDHGADQKASVGHAASFFSATHDETKEPEAEPQPQPL